MEKHQQLPEAHFPPVKYDGRAFIIGQCNNVFVFPGIGLGCIVAEVRQIPDSIFLTAAHTLSDCVTKDRFEAGALYPDQNDLRDVSRKIAIAVVKEAKRLNIGKLIAEDHIENAIDEMTWFPEYKNYILDEK